MSEWMIWQLADSAFPAGSFAHSCGLEAAWQAGDVRDVDGLRQFVRDVTWQAGRGSLPLLTSAHRMPARLDDLDALADVFLTNPVANRASRVQGRAFLATCARTWPRRELRELEVTLPDLAGHCAPITGAVLRHVDVPLPLAQRLFLYNTARSVLAAAVRLGVTGTYQAQRLQFECGSVLDAVLDACAALDERDLAQTAPIVDLWQASHDRLYSRLFQS